MVNELKVAGQGRLSAIKSQQEKFGAGKPTMRQIFLGILVTCIVFISSCSSLDHINQFSKTSVQGIQGSENITLSFTKICQQYSRPAFQYSIRTNSEEPTPNINCDDERYADSILSIYQTLITSYLSGLNKLSGGDLTTFDLNGLASNLKGLKGQCKVTQVSDGQIAAAQGIASNLLKWAFDIYRAASLKKIIQNTDVSFRNLLDAYKLSLLALKGRITQARVDYKAFVFADSKTGYLAATNDIERNAAILNQDAFYAMCSKEQAKIDAYIVVINSIEEGHKNLAILSPSIQAGIVKSYLTQATQNIQTLNSTFKNLLKK